MPEYLKVSGHDVYCYEWDNEGEAVVLLHGGLSKTSSWDYLLVPALEDDFHVYAYDRTGHGFTGDQPDSLHFQFQCNEAIAYLEEVTSVLKEMLENIKWRHQNIKNMIEWRKFTSGI